KGKTNNFEILRYKLGTTDMNLTVDLGNDEVIVNKMDSEFGRTHITGQGSVNYRSADIALGINSNNTNHSDLSQILTPIFEDLDFLPEDLNFQARVDVDIFGKYRLPELKVRSKFNFSDVTAYGEGFNSASVDIGLAEELLSLKNFTAEKSGGTILGDFFYNLKDKKIKLSYQWDNLKLSSFNLSKRLGLNLDSDITGKINGGGTVSNYTLKLDTTAYNTHTTNYTFGDSTVSTTIQKDRIAGDANLLGDMLVTNFDVALKQGEASA